MNNEDIVISFAFNDTYTPLDPNYKHEYWLETCFECKQRIPVAEKLFYKGHRAHNACILLHTGTSARKNIKGMFG